MIELKCAQDLAKLRRLALAAQGLLQVRPFGKGLAGARRAINHIGYVQIDTISVVERAHHHVLYSRLPDYKPSMINKMLIDHDIFEYWVHAAAYLPIADFRFSLPYKQAIKSGQVHWYRNPDKKLMGELLARIRAEGPIRSRDVSSKENMHTGWWDWKPAKKALEQLYMQGDLMVSSREGFQKVYDLTERVLPGHIHSHMPTMEEYAKHILDQQLRCHGVVTLKELTNLRRDKELRQAVSKLVNDSLLQGTLEQVQIYNGDVYLIKAGELERPFPRLNSRVKILSPFDNGVIQRNRLKVLFKYDYQIECYVPAAKRKFGYFCLPLLYRDAFIGRIDCKAHRKTRHFEIISLHVEKHNFDVESVMAALIDAVIKFCHFQNCDSISLTKAHPNHLTQPINQALTSHG